MNFEQAKVEMHILAYIYHWDRDTLWELSFKERKMWCDLISKQKEEEKNEIEKATRK